MASKKSWLRPSDEIKNGPRSRNLQREGIYDSKGACLLRSKEKTIFLSADHLQEQADARVREAEQLPDGEARQNALKNAAHLRSYADMKRLLAPVPKPKKTTD